MIMQQTLLNEVEFGGVALHSGLDVKIRILPSDENSGIVFFRSDISESPAIFARFDNVSETRLRNTTVGDLGGAFVQTTEHLMASFYILGIDNAVVFCSSSEMPVLDGSAFEFIKMINKGGILTQNAPRKFLRILKEVSVSDGESFVSLSPFSDGLFVDAELVYPEKIIGQQCFKTKIEKKSFISDISKARTFGKISEHEQLKKMGMAKGANMDNVIVISDDEVLNPSGLFYENEFVRHKIIDIVGDFFLSGFHIFGKVRSFKGSHALNNLLLRKLFFNSESCFEIFEK